MEECAFLLFVCVVVRRSLYHLLSLLRMVAYSTRRPYQISILFCSVFFSFSVYSLCYGVYTHLLPSGRVDERRQMTTSRPFSSSRLPGSPDRGFFDF